MRLVGVEAKPSGRILELVQGRGVVNVAFFLHQQRVIRGGGVSFETPAGIRGPAPPAQGLCHHLEFDSFLEQVLDIIQDDIHFDVLIIVLHGDGGGNESFS